MSKLEGWASYFDDTPDMDALNYIRSTPGVLHETCATATGTPIVPFDARRLKDHHMGATAVVQYGIFLSKGQIGYALFLPMDAHKEYMKRYHY